MPHGRRPCVLCRAAATVYCRNDDAFLCAGCDAHVHGCSALAAAHERLSVAAYLHAAGESESATHAPLLGHPPAPAQLPQSLASSRPGLADALSAAFEAAHHHLAGQPLRHYGAPVPQYDAPLAYRPCSLLPGAPPAPSPFHLPARALPAPPPLPPAGGWCPLVAAHHSSAGSCDTRWDGAPPPPALDAMLMECLEGMGGGEAGSLADFTLELARLAVPQRAAQLLGSCAEDVALIHGGDHAMRDPAEALLAPHITHPVGPSPPPAAHRPEHAAGAAAHGRHAQRQQQRQLAAASEAQLHAELAAAAERLKREQQEGLAAAAPGSAGWPRLAAAARDSGGGTPPPPSTATAAGEHLAAMASELWPPNEPGAMLRPGGAGSPSVLLHSAPPPPTHPRPMVVVSTAAPPPPARPAAPGAAPAGGHRSHPGATDAAASPGQTVAHAAAAAVATPAGRGTASRRPARAAAAEAAARVAATAAAEARDDDGFAEPAAVPACPSPPAPGSVSPAAPQSPSRGAAVASRPWPARARGAPPTPRRGGPGGGEVFIPPYREGETRADKLARYRAKKLRRSFNPTVRYACRKHYADKRPRIKGRFVSPEEFAAWHAQQAAGSGGSSSGDAP